MNKHKVPLDAFEAKAAEDKRKRKQAKNKRRHDNLARRANESRSKQKK